MKIAVIGRGLIGSAAARHLALMGHEVTLIGPDEPVDKAAHRGVFGSHYDAGRITRTLDADGFWADVSNASVARYAGLEAESGIRFFTECGALLAGVRGSDWMAQVDQVRRSRGIAAHPLSGDALRAAFPYFRFPDETDAYFEPQGAGYINPRRMIAAQSVVFEQAGGAILSATAQSLRNTGQGVQVRTEMGDVDADRVLVAAGGFSNALLDNALQLTVYARTVVLLALAPAEVARLTGMPSLVLRLADGRDPYLLPPIAYPDGTTYLKLGGDPTDTVVERDGIGDWFRSGGSAEVGRHLADLACEIVPDLAVASVRTDACVTVFTAADRPVIDRLSERVAVAVAGCGRGAKCSDELGRLGAEAVLGHTQPELTLAATARQSGPLKLK